MLKNIAILCTLVILPVLAQENSCVNPDRTSGKCTSLVNCQLFIDRYNADRTFRNFLQMSNRACRQPSPIICCPEQEEPVTRPTIATKPPVTNPISNTNSIFPSPGDQCGLSSNTYKKIVGGEPSALGGWPWITLIGYTDSLGATSFKCGGALITQKYVLTAAHCIRTDLTHVRLGEHNLDIETEANHIDINVNKIIKHASFNSKDGLSDIALLRLENTAPNTKFIHPVCLPTSQQLKTKSYINSSPFVAGWGRTEEGGKSAAILQQIQIPVHPNSLCKDRYAKKNRLQSERQFGNEVICAGVLAGGKDTCQGDSGGPLMVPVLINNIIYYHLIGVVSYGIGCARPEVPGIYTNVPVFMDWIEQQITANP